MEFRFRWGYIGIQPNQFLFGMNWGFALVRDGAFIHFKGKPVRTFTIYVGVIDISIYYT